MLPSLEPYTYSSSIEGEKMCAIVTLILEIQMEVWLANTCMVRLGCKLYLEAKVRGEKIICVCHEEPTYVNVLNTAHKAEKIITLLI